MTDYADVSFELKPEFLKVTQYILREQAGLKSGERVLLIYDSHTPQHVIDAFLGTAAQAGAEVYALKTPMAPHPAVQPGFVWSQLVISAAEEADLIIDMAIGYAEFLVKLAKKGARIIVPGDATGAPHIEDSLIRCLMLEDPRAVRREAKAIGKIMDAGKVMRVTSAAGTDFTLNIDGLDADVGDGFMYDENGELLTSYQITPGGMPGFIVPAGSGDGVLALDGIMLYENVHHIPRDPVFFTMEKGRIREITGDRYVATRLRQWLKSLNDENAYNGPVHINLGLSRMARLTEHLEWERVRGAVVCGFGDNSILAPYYARKKMALSRSIVHWDVQMQIATIDIDGQRICEDGVVGEFV
ncbi:hypothetical protein [Phenylobacterium sp.]|uniref:hypothetical protein n=1 Tax=Phenylobacterium sp. TaxID=1871053 RepID=UPI0035B1BDD9